LFGTDKQAKEATQVVVRFMQLMAEKKPQAAESLFSQQTNPDQVHGDLASLDEGPNFVLFEGYQALKVINYNVVHKQGCILNSHIIALSAAVQYDDGSSGRLDASLLKENESWALLDFGVTVPPVKTLRTQSPP
jgi:hypothetical protein